MARRGVEDQRHGIHAEAVEADLFEPVAGIGQIEGADALAVAAVVVDGGAPRRIGLFGVGGIGPAVVAFRAEVVVDHVQNHGDAQIVGCLNEGLQIGIAAIGSVQGEQVGAVIAPVALAGEGGQRQQLDHRNAEGLQVRQLGPGGGQGPLRGEGADMQFIDDGIFDGDAAPAVRLDAGWIGHRRGAMHAVRLGTGGRVRIGGAVQLEAVAAALGQPGQAQAPVADGIALHRQAASLILEAQRHLLAIRSEDAKCRLTLFVDVVT